MSYQKYEDCLPIQCGPTAKAVLLSLAHRHNGETGRCDPSLTTIMRDTSLSRTAVIDALNDLVKAGKIARERRVGTSNNYLLHPSATPTRPPRAPVRQTHSPRPPGAPPGSAKHTPPVRLADPNRKEQERTESEQEGNSTEDFLRLETEETSQTPFQTAWNATKLPAIQRMGPARAKALATRLKEPWWRDNWRAGLARCASSPFCNGTNDRGWRADSDWFLKPGTLAKILEGKYDARDVQVRPDLDQPINAHLGPVRNQWGTENPFPDFDPDQLPKRKKHA